MEKSMSIIENGLAERDKVQIGLKWPLPKAIIILVSKIDNKELMPRLGNSYLTCNRRGTILA